MARIRDVVQKIRSKNAGPFWLTIDIFCGDTESFARICKSLETVAVATQLGESSDALKRFEIEALNVIKFSLPRPAVQGSRDDRDMHGASWANLIAEMEIS